MDVKAVPHATPLSTGTQNPGTQKSTTQKSTTQADDELNQQIADVLIELIKQVQNLGQRIASDFGLTGSDAMALLKLEVPMTMKELGQKMSCDPSFVTTIADALEKHGLARREPSQRDRRSKNIVLTRDGETVRERLLREVATRAPWCALDTGERKCLLGLMGKMLRLRDGR